jgi:hypothetical protein
VRVAAVLACLGIAAASAGLAYSAPAATKVVDRTLVCTTGYHGGANVIYLRAQTAYGQGDRLDWLTGVYVSTAGQPVPSRPNYQPSLAGVNAGWPPPPMVKSGGLGYNEQRCTPTKTRVELGRRGLVGGPADTFGDDYSCIAPRRILVRVRATFRTAPSLTTRRGAFAAEGRVVRGELAVRTLTGKALVYGEVRERGGARLFTTGGCG